MENQSATQTTKTLDVTSLPTLQEVERQYLNLVLTQTAGNKAQAAKILGVSIKTIYNKLDTYKTVESTTTQAV